MFPFVSQVNNFFSFRESFSRRPSVVFSRREERLCSTLLSKSTTFFSFRETFCFTVKQVVFLQSRGAFMLPFASGVNRYFSFPRNFISLAYP